MIESSKVHKILYGGDYNPEQWPEEIWKEDMRLFKLAHIDVVTLNVFSWAALQPDEITYDFSKLDKIMEYVKENGLKVCFATSTGAHPAWMARKYPDILRVGHNGMKRVTIPVRTARLTGNILWHLPQNWQSDTKIMTISLHGIFPMNMAGNVTAKTVKKHSVYGCIKNMERWMS